MSKISVIVPVYNVEKYLRRCIDSIINQTYKDLEIILVDDGSPDNSPAICDEYKSKDNRIKVIHKNNGGLSDARNAGLDIATGEYIGFVDSDDYIHENMYEYLLSLIDKFNADASMGEFFHCYPNKPIKEETERPIELVDGEKAVYYIFESKLASLTVVNKLYKKSLFNNLRFKVDKISEDAFIFVDLFIKANKVVISNKQIYYYFHRFDSITNIKFNNNDFQAIEAWDYSYKKAMELNPELFHNVALMRCCWIRFFVLDKMALAGYHNSQKRKEIILFLKNNRKFIINNNILTKTRKISFLTLYFGFGVYSLLAKMNFKKNKGSFE